jgi:hypothetical protein
MDLMALRGSRLRRAFCLKRDEERGAAAAGGAGAGGKVKWGEDYVLIMILRL